MKTAEPSPGEANMTANMTVNATITDEEGRDILVCPCYEPGWPPSPACC